MDFFCLLLALFNEYTHQYLESLLADGIIEVGWSYARHDKEHHDAAPRRLRPQACRDGDQAQSLHDVRAVLRRHSSQSHERHDQAAQAQHVHVVRRTRAGRRGLRGNGDGSACNRYRETNRTSAELYQTGSGKPQEQSQHNQQSQKPSLQQQL